MPLNSLSVITAAITLTVKLVAKSHFTINTFKTKWWVINWERLHCTVNMALAIQVVEIRGPVHCSTINLCLSTFIYKLCHFHKTELSVKKNELDHLRPQIYRLISCLYDPSIVYARTSDFLLAFFILQYPPHM